MNWFLENGPEVSGRNMANMKARGRGERLLLVLASKDSLIRILERCSTRASVSVTRHLIPIEVTQGLAWKLTVKDTKSVIGPGVQIRNVWW
ncbi:hypothetical protein EDB83DRAFT_2433258 [Lactarius deliciosus]|nr:hypothetical protein EDB83DRAFT_2433258 [Lactarius deliciosus]